MPRLASGMHNWSRIDDLNKTGHAPSLPVWKISCEVQEGRADARHERAQNAMTNLRCQGAIDR
jgi:hypothetical protein